MRRQHVRIASYNVHSCIGIDGRCAPERIAEVIADIDPDIACLQEIDVGRARTGGANQAAEIALSLAMQFHFNATITEVSGSYGDAILSKTPLTLRAARSLSPVPRPLPRESRGAIWIETEQDGRAWQVINTHFGLGRAERRLQARELVSEWISPAMAHPLVVLCGDLNSRPSSLVHEIIGVPLRDVFRQRNLSPPRTFSTRWPFVCLDYLFISPGVEVQEAECWKTPTTALASDHFPIVAQLNAR